MGLQFPSEILISIILDSSLDARDAAAIQLVNHFFHDLYQSSIHLQYELECEVAQVMDNPYCNLSVGRRLHMLRDQEAAWRSLIPAATKSIPGPDLTRNWGYRIETSHLLCIGSKPWPNFMDTIVKSSSIQRLGESEEDHSGFRLTTNNEEAHLLSTCIAEHGLFATLSWTRNPDFGGLLYELEVHLFEHSTGKAHPRAMKPCITLYRVPESIEIDDDATFSMAMEVFGENLVVTNEAYSYGSDDFIAFLYIYNWKTGDAKCEPIPLSNAGFIVLDYDLVLIPDNKSWTFLIYHIPPSSAGAPVKLIKRLGLPPLSTPCPDIERTECKCAPNPTGDGHFPRHISPSVPFITRPESAIALFKWDINQQPTEMIVHRNSLMNLLPPRDEWRTMTDPSITDWDTWGPPVALWRNFKRGFTHPAATHGQRLIDIPNKKRNRDSVLEDFNKYHVDPSREEEGNHFTFQSKHFLHPIISHLPFVRLASPVISNYEGVFITDGLIVGVKETRRREAGNTSGTTHCDILYLFR